MIRLFKTSQLVDEEDERIMKSVAEITTIMMRMEQNRKNGGVDEIDYFQAMKTIKKLHGGIKKRTDYKLMKIKLKKWMQQIAKDLRELTRRHEKRIYVEGAWRMLNKQIESEKFYTQRKITQYTLQNNT